MKVLESTIERQFERSISYARSAIRSFTSAILVNRENHQAYAGRAWMFATFCKRSEAESDYYTAISIAVRLGREQEANEYRDKLTFGSSECREEYRDHL
jgi:hypothetical protein